MCDVMMFNKNTVRVQRHWDGSAAAAVARDVHISGGGKIQRPLFRQEGELHVVLTTYSGVHYSSKPFFSSKRMRPVNSRSTWRYDVTISYHEKIERL